MMTVENSDLYEVTCLDCNTTKSYFTAQGVSFFKLNHEGHKLKVKEPTRAKGTSPAEEVAPVEVAEPVAEPAREAEPEVEAKEEPAEVKDEEPVRQVMADERVRLGNLVVDVVDEEKGRSVKVYGIAGGQEKFSKEFETFKVAELNVFLESGTFFDVSTRTTYVWTPDKIDLSPDVTRMIEEPPEAPKEQLAPTEQAPAVDTVAEPVPEQKADVALVPEPRVVASQDVKSSPSQPDEVLLGKLSYIQPGEEYRRESIRISKVLRKFRWNVEPPYVIGAMFDNLMSVQAQTGMIKASLIDAVVKLGYTFVAVEAPAGMVTAWFRKSQRAQTEPEEEIESAQTTPA